MVLTWGMEVAGIEIKWWGYLWLIQRHILQFRSVFNQQMTMWTKSFPPAFTARILQIFSEFKSVIWSTGEIESIAAETSRAGPFGADCASFAVRWRTYLNFLRKRTKQSSVRGFCWFQQPGEKGHPSVLWPNYKTGGILKIKINSWNST